MGIVTVLRGSMIATLALVATASSARAQVISQPYASPQGQVAPAPGQAPQGGTVYVIDPAAAAQTVAQLQGRLLELRTLRSQYRVGGPIAMMAVGAGTFVVASFTAMAFGLARATTGDISPEGRNRVRAERIAGGFALLGAALTIGGGIRLGDRLRMRRQFNPEMQLIRQQLRMYQQQGFVIQVGSRSFGAGLRLVF